MVNAKQELFNMELQEAARLYKSLGHPARLAILHYLSTCSSCISGDISEVLPLSRTTVSQHLKELKKTGLIKGEVEGARVNYCLNHDTINRLKAITNPLLESLSGVNPKQC
jgi:ArsR family transcriptional regulator, arsenate/arsenite/antimonite-responsive transcriptional repressor